MITRRCLYQACHSLRLWDRYARSLLEFFHCHRCGKPSLDPLGRDQKGQWLCEICANGEGPG